MGLVFQFRGHSIGLQIDGVFVYIRLNFFVLFADDTDHFTVLAAIILYLFYLLVQTIKRNLLLLNQLSQLTLFEL